MRHDCRITQAAIIAAALLGLSGSSIAQGTTGVAPPATVIEKDNVLGILGRQVLDAAGEDMGRVIDIVVDRSGQVRAAIIDFGGFLGVGSRKIAVDWAALRFAPTGSRYDRITLDLTRDQVRAAPEYKVGRPLAVIGAVDSLPSPSPPAPQ